MKKLLTDIVSFLYYTLVIIASLPFILFIILSRFIKTEKIDMALVFAIISVITYFCISSYDSSHLFYSSTLHMFLAELCFSAILLWSYFLFAYIGYKFTKTNIKFSIKNYYNYVKNWIENINIK